ncbi:cell envelope integrity protein CreD [Edaphobacter bradus]|uniref:cell envelope integrity protein CreD n=1 Tax=Edaphobacter bradus TaxID=2259016 RepID=UPI0021DF6CEF|nr:cell envelope integrity protein CreD [Edaphobacter bradus]
MGRLVPKMFAVGFLTLIILIALGAVYGVIESRQAYRDQAVHSISASYAGPQTIVGPIFVQPYSQLTQDVTVGNDGKPKVTSSTVEASYIVFPQTLTLLGRMVPTQRYHGLYRVSVYEMQTKLTGEIEVPELRFEGKVTYGTPYLAMSVSDVRGIVGRPAVAANGQALRIFQGGTLPSRVASDSGTKQGSEGWQPNLQMPLPGAVRGAYAKYSFSLDMSLAGTQNLAVAPVAATNHIEINSTWPSPLFEGQFLPRDREVSKSGFQAAWDVSSLASATQRQIAERTDGVDTLSVDLISPIDPYKLSDRAVKYGILFILLTFGGFFVFEIMKQLPIHPIQYLLVGFGLTIFFLLLISLSEHIAFPAAYFLASLACIGLLTFYLTYVLHSLMRGLGFGSMLTLLYATIYGLLISEDNALVLGSMMLFVILAAVMFVTRKVDWYRGAAELISSRTPPPPVPVQPPSIPPAQRAEG